jgi:hypothetical protein
MAGASQAAWTELGQALGDWLVHQERRAAELAQESRSQAQWLRLGVAAFMGTLLLACLGWLLRLRPHVIADPAPFVASRPPADDDRLPSALDDIATQSRLVALNAAVQAARHGEPSDTEMAERVRLAVEAEELARRCDAARKNLRLGAGARSTGRVAA